MADITIKDEALILRRGDIIVLKTDYRVTLEEVEHVGKRLAALGVEAIIVGPGWSVERQAVEHELASADRKDADA